MIYLSSEETDSANQVQILDEAFRPIAFAKDMNPRLYIIIYTIYNLHL